MTTNVHSNVKKNAAKYFDGNDYDFCMRVWNTDSDIYVNRLKAIRFNNFDKVLDAGFGLAQWTYALAGMNTEVVGVEFDEKRFEFSKKLFNEIGVENASFYHGNVEALSFEDNSFDAVFSYSVICNTDYRKSLKEFYRVLKPGGKLYFNTNGLGWYLYNLIHTHNDTNAFSSKEMAKTAISKAIHYYATGELIRGNYSSIVTPNEIVTQDLKQIGFKNIVSGAEGTLNIGNQLIKPFFKGEYEGAEGVTEYLCEK